MRIEFNLEEIGVIVDPDNIIDRKGNKLSLKKLNGILSLIAYKYVYSEFEKVNINSNNFKDICNEYVLYLKYLRHKEVILWTNYKKGEYSRGYIFTDLFKQRAEITKIYLGDIEKKELIQDYSISIDSLVIKRLEKDFNKLVVYGKIPTEKKLLFIKDEVEVYDFKGYISTQIHFQKIKYNNTYYNWTSGRLYTSFNNCSKESRLNNFSFGNNTNKLVSLDISSSFPLFLSVWLINKGIDIEDYDFKIWCSYIKEKRDKSGNSIFYKELRNIYDKLKDSDGDEKFNNDLNIYTKYEKPHISYNKAKTMFQKWLNGDCKDDIINNGIKFNFTSIYDLVCSFKSLYMNIAEEDRNKIMYKEIVKLETDFIMNKICSRLYNEVDGIKLLTCHDEIYFEEKYLDFAKNIWDEELNKIYDLLPTTYENNFDGDDTIMDGFIEDKIEDVKIVPWSKRRKNEIFDVDDIN